MALAHDGALHRVRTRLLAAFSTLMLAAVALMAVGWYGMRSTQQALAGFEGALLPSIAHALELAERTAQLAAIAPKLSDARTAEALEGNIANVEELLDQIHRRSVDLRPTREMQSALDRLQPVVGRDVAALIALARQKRASYQRFQEQLADLDRIGLELQAHGAAPGDPMVAAVWSSLVLGSNADSAATLGRLEADVEALLLAADRRHAFAAYDPALARALSAAATGPENLLALRRGLLDLERRTGMLVVLTRATAEELADQVARYVAQLRGTAAARSERVGRAVRSGKTSLLFLALVCLAVAAGATRYVWRLVSQIEKITDVMSRLAQGDTAQPMPATNRRDELGALARTFEVFRDNLIARRAVEAQLQQAQRLEVLGQLTGGVAHDFNNYLGTILGNLSLFESKSAVDPEARAQLQRVRRAATSAAALTRRLLAFARRQPLQAEQVAVDDLIEEMRDLVEYSAGPQVAVSLELGSASLQVYVDRGQLENALLNLALNSAAAMPAGGRLTVSTHPVEEPGDEGRRAVAITVADSGTGIPDHLQEKVFEPFFTTKVAGKGSGLGLSIVYGFVKQSGGEIALTSKLGCGTRVVLTFPASLPVTRPEPVLGAPIPFPAALAEFRVLVVEDDDAFRATVTDLLARARVQSVSVASVEEALAVLERGGPIGALLSDICMGSGMDGLSLARAVRVRWPEVPVVLMSGLSPELLAGETGWSADLPFLQKPFTLEVLVGCLEKLRADRADDHPPA